MTARLARDERGATLVEFSLMIGVLATLLLGIIQVGEALRARAEVSSALGQAVRVVYITPDISADALEAELARRLAGSRATDFEVAVETVDGVRALRVVVRFAYDIALPFLPLRSVPMRIETVTPAVMPRQEEAT